LKTLSMERVNCELAWAPRRELRPFTQRSGKIPDHMKILLAIDGSECSQAATLAVITRFPPVRSEVRVFHADDWPNRMSTALGFAEGPTAASDILGARDERRRQGHNLVSRAEQQLQAAGFHTSTAVRDGDPRHAILDAAAEWNPDVIVVGSHGRHGLDRFLLGSVSESIVRHASCSVDIVRVGPTIAT
jgi:nucleotide-binding universal stress UspA family protein